MSGKIYTILIMLLFFAGSTFADGLMRPEDQNYPKDLLQNRCTKIWVKIHGQIAETIVYQEFVNEWHRPTGAVYNFPLAPDARATDLFYWYHDTCFQAVLKVKEQAVNPGTGEGGIAVELNKYLGRNGIKMHIKEIQPGAIQKVKLHFISLCKYYNGELTYEYPLETQQFVTYPLDLLSVDIDLHTNSDIESFDIPGFSDCQTTINEPQHINIRLDKSKTYLSQNLIFKYKVPMDETKVDFYSVANDSMDGHFVLTVNPDETVEDAGVMSERIVFVLNNTSNMFGYRFDQAKEAIAQCLDLMSEADYFDIMVFNYNVNSWRGQLVAATPENISAAKSYLNSVSTGWGSDVESALKQALTRFPDAAVCNSIILFSNGYSPVDPAEISRENTHKAGIFSVGYGDEIDRAKLEMISLLNYGFVTYFDENDNLKAGIARLYEQISRPIMIDTNYEFGAADIYGLQPRTFPALFQGSRFFMTGRYKNPGMSAVSVAGTSTDGITALDYRLPFSSETDQHKFAERIWAKETIDDIERQIAVYGENDSLKNMDIAISLQYNIRCKYTAFIADYENEATTVRSLEPEIAQPVTSYIVGNYPNPFNPTTHIRFFLDEKAGQFGQKFIRIYNMLGQLVAIIDISKLGPGMHTVMFNGKNFWGNALPSGVYICQLVAGNQMSTIRVSLMK